MDVVPSLERASVRGKDRGLGWKALEDYVPGWKWDLWKNGSDDAAMSERKGGPEAISCFCFAWFLRQCWP